MRSDQSYDELSSVFWPSPSPEEEVRKRVWRRTRRIRAQRLVPAAAAVMVVLAAVVPMAVRDSDETSSLRTADNGVPAFEEEGVEVSPEKTVSSLEPQDIPEKGVTGPEGVKVPLPESVGPVKAFPPPPPATEGPKAGPVMVDPADDAGYQGDVSADERLAAVDIVSNDVVCAGDTFRFIFAVNDLDRSLPANRQGSKVEEAVYRQGIDHDGGSVMFTVTRRQSDGSVRVSGQASVYAPENVVQSQTAPIEGVTVRIDEGADAIVIESSFTAVEAAERKASSSSAPGFRRGVAVSGMGADTVVYFEPRNRVVLTSNADQAQWDRWTNSYHMCD